MNPIDVLIPILLIAVLLITNHIRASVIDLCSIVRGLEQRVADLENPQ